MHGVNAIIPLVTMVEKIQTKKNKTTIIILDIWTELNRCIMMISIKAYGDEKFYINTDLIESIIERQGNTSEIRLTNGHIYTSIESPEKLSNRISMAQMSSQLAKPKSNLTT
jgi:uncharacterized protein YlzI (FlbEa/FlbD family)